MRRAVKIASWSAGIALLLVVASLGVVLVAGNTPGGRLWLEVLTSRLTGGQVRLSGLGGSLPGSIVLDRLQLLDERGVWLTAERVSLTWSPQALLSRHIKMSRLHAGWLELERLPVLRPKNESQPSGWPRIDADSVTVDRLVLGAGLVGTRALLSLQASAHLGSGREAAAEFHARRLDGSDSYQLQLRTDDTHIDADFRLQESPGGVLQSYLRLPGTGALAVTGELRGARSAERLQLEVRAGELRGEAHGTLDLVGRAADLRYALRAPAMRPRPDLSWERLDIGGRWHGSLSAPQADGELQVDALHLPGGASVAAVRADLRAAAGILTVHATAGGTELPGAHHDLLRASALRLDLAARLDDPARALTLTASHRLFAAEARVLLKQQSVTFEVRVPDVAPFAALAGEQARGSAAIRGRAALDAGTTRVSADADADITGEAALWRLLGRTPRLQLAASAAQDGMQVERLTLTGRAGTLVASGSLTGSGDARANQAPAPELRARWDLTVPDLSYVAGALAGRLALAGEAEGPLSSFRVRMQATSALSVRGSPLGEIRASLEARGLPGEPGGTLRAQGLLDGAPLRLEAALERPRADVVRVTLTDAQWKSARVQGEITAGTKLSQARGTVHLGLEQLADLDRLLGVAVRGSLAGDLALTQSNGKTRMRLQLAAQDVVAAGVSGSARLEASGALDTPGVKLSVRLPDLQGSPAEFSAAGRVNLESRELKLAQFAASYRHQSLQLLAPATLAFADGIGVQKLRLGLRQAVLEVDGRLAPTLDMHASVHKVDSALVSAFAPGVLAQGELEGTARLTGLPGAPTGQVTFRATNLRLAGDSVRELPALDIRGDVRLAGDAAQLEARLSGGADLQLTLKGQAPLNSRGAFDLALRGNLDLGFANPLLESNGRHASGRLSADLTVTGTATTPEIAGSLNLTGGDLRDYRLGLHLAQVEGQMTGAHGNLQITRLSARAAPGQITMSGSIGILQPHLPVDLTLTAHDAAPLASDVLTMQLDADLRIKGTLREHLDLSGKVDIERADINIPNRFPPNVVVLDVRRRGQAPPPPATSRRALGFDLALSAPRHILVRGRGLDAELGGELRMRGTRADPQVSGGFDLIRGAFSLGSSRLTFTSGRVGIDSAGLQGRIDPTLDFTAESSVGDSTVTLRVTGLADAPQFALTSAPPLPQDEILARLLFGQSASTLSAAQAAQVGGALATLTGMRGDRLNVLSRVQKSLGLDRLALESATNGGSGDSQSSSVAIAAGRYVTDRVYVAGRQSSEIGMQLEVDVDLSQRLKVRTRLGNNNTTVQNPTPENDPGSSIGMSYQFEY